MSRYACIDIGSNTTSLLVAEPFEGRLRTLLQQKAFTRVGGAIGKSGRIAGAKIAEVVEVVATQLRLVAELDAEWIKIVATAPARYSTNGSELTDAITAETGVEVEMLDGRDEARFAFVGATRSFPNTNGEAIGVVDVGGGSTELTVGSVREGVTWCESFRIGSGFIADSYLSSDPPSIDQLHAARLHASGVFEGLALPEVHGSVAVGGSATSLRRVVGNEFDVESLGRALRACSVQPAAIVAHRFGLNIERARLLPAGILILETVAELFNSPLRIGKGGLREGIILHAISDADTSAP